MWGIWAKEEIRKDTYDKEQKERNHQEKRKRAEQGSESMKHGSQDF